MPLVSDELETEQLAVLVPEVQPESVQVPSVLVPSAVTVAVPVTATELPPSTLTVKVTDWFTDEGLGAAVTVVVVDAAETESDRFPELVL